MNQDTPIIIGIDWADAKHDFHLIDAKGEVHTGVFTQSAEAINTQLEAWRKASPNAKFAIALESSKGAFINGLIEHDDVTIYPINPAALSHHRKSFAHGGGKSDPVDAKRIAGFLKDRIDELRPLCRDSPETRELSLMSQERRLAVDARADMGNELTSLLKQYFPAALGLKAAKPYASFLLSFLIQYPTLQLAQAAGESTLRNFFHGVAKKNDADQYAKMLVAAEPLTTDEVTLRCGKRRALMLAEQLRVLNKHIRSQEREIKKLVAAHPAYALAKSMPGTAANTQARIIGAMGDDPERYASAASLQCATGIAPITEQSGKRKYSIARWACTKFLRQTFHEMAGLSIGKSAWATAYYDQQKAKGKSTSTAKRALAFKWQRIIYRCWQTGEPYNEERYIERLQATGSPLYEAIQNAA